MRFGALAMHLLRAMLVGTVLVAGIQAAAAQGRRVALVVGNSAYQMVPRLANPANDARLMARTLKSLGFQLIGDDARLNLDKAGFDAAVRTFGQALAGAEIALFYYAGHGLQVQGANWLVPLDANPTRVQDLDFQMVDASLVLRQMEGAGTRLNVMILDACRNNPFGGRGLRGSEAGLAQMRAPEGTLISYATQPGNTAQDGVGANSPYTQALAEAMAQPGLDVLRMFNRVGVAVKRATSGQQQPWVSSSPIEGEYFFAGAGSNPVPAVPPATPPAAPSPALPAVNPAVPRTPGPSPAGATGNLAGRWSPANSDTCSGANIGVVSVGDGYIRFEWRRPRGRPNIAMERIDAVEGNVVYTTVESDENTDTPEVGHRMRYVITPASWTSRNLTTGRTFTHRRC